MAGDYNVNVNPNTGQTYWPVYPYPTCPHVCPGCGRPYTYPQYPTPYPTPYWVNTGAQC